MSFLASVFGNKQPNTQPAQPVQTPHGMPANSNNNSNIQGPGTGSEPKGTQAAPPVAPQDPMDAYIKMFDNSSVKNEVAPQFSLDDGVLDSVANNLDFMQGIDPELMQKATSGDINSIMQLMQASNRNAYKTIMKHQSGLTDKFIGLREQHNDKNFSSKIRGELTVNELSANSGQQHPVVRTQLIEIAKKMQQQNPDASPQEIARASKEYVNDLYKAMNPGSGTAQNDNSNGKNSAPVNWDTFFDEN